MREKTIEKKRETSSFLSQKEIEDDDAKYERFKKNKEKAQQQLEKKKRETEQSGSPLGFIYGTLPTTLPTTKNSTKSPAENSDVTLLFPTSVADDGPGVTEESQSPRLRTDNDIYKKFGVKEKSVINAVYNAIYNAIADEDMREGLIKKIEKELTK